LQFGRVFSSSLTAPVPRKRVFFPMGFVKRARSVA